jgi:hypothetical protein
VHIVAAGVEAVTVAGEALNPPTTAVTLVDLISTTRTDDRSLSTPFSTELRASECLPGDIDGSLPEQS